jgi:uncharacterized protein
MPHEASRSTRQTSRCIGIDDGPFPPKTNDKPRYAPLVAAWLKGPHLQRLNTSWITVDGLDATRTAQKLIRGSTRVPILLSGVTFGGFNLIDPWKIHHVSRGPTIVVIGSRPNNGAVKRALTRHFPDWRERWDVFKSLGALRKLRTVPGESPIFFEKFGCSTRESELLLKSWAVVSRIPEPLRVAGLVARGLFPQEPFG